MMKTLLATLLLAAVAFSQTTSPSGEAPQQQAGATAARPALIKKLQADLDEAGARATFSEQQRQEFTAAVETLRKQGERRRKDGAMDRGSVRDALQTLRGLSASEAFQSQDRAVLKKDFQDLRKASRNRSGKGRGGRAARTKTAD